MLIKQILEARLQGLILQIFFRYGIGRLYCGDCWKKE